MNKHDEMKYAEMYSKWYSWGSPIGLGIFLISLAITGLIIMSALNCWKDGNQKRCIVEQVQKQQVQ